MIADSHFHALAMHKRNLTPDLENVIGIDVGTEPDDYPEREPLLPHSAAIFASAGAGPWCTENLSTSIDSIVDTIRKNIMDWNLDAIGECGEDYFHEYGSHEQQQELFYKQSELANELGLPLIIHSRDARKELIGYLGSESVAEHGIMHCFSYDRETVMNALDKGFYISFSGNITYKGNEGIREAMLAVPDDRLLVETDSPYLAPIPMRPRPCIPEFTEITLSLMADLRGTDKDILKEKIIGNIRKVLGRDESVRKMGF